MGNSTPRQLLRLACLMLLLAGCTSEDQYADIRGFMNDVADKPKGQLAPLPEFEPYQPFTYGAANRRSPFEPEVVAPPKTTEQRKNIGVKPPKDHVKQYLERFSLTSLSMVGTLQQNNSTWALVEDNTGGVHMVQVGDYMGSQWGQIESIDDSRIDITEIVSDGASGWLRRPRTIEIKGLD
ncbi:MAG: pilus assembly protein PilP [Proteobacteria bacterium]|nr:pilus assembly protein PilP [Pseudomonadota bacterium]